MTDLLIIVPTRSRPEAVERVVDAWHATGAFDDGAELLFVVDRDDPRYLEYLDAVAAAERAELWDIPAWLPLVPKLNGVARDQAGAIDSPYAIGFAGDDHLPRTPRWVSAYLRRLRSGPGVVSCADGYRTDDLPTQWAMTTDIVRALGGMVPAPVEHLYCDDAVRDLAKAADCYTYLPDVLIEHMHPVAGKAASDEQYDRVNSRQQYRGDRAAYRLWRDTELAIQAARVRDLIQERGTTS